MQRTGQALSPFSSRLLFALISLCIITTGALDTYGQDLVPPTAAQAAKVPQFASRLGHALPPSPVASRKNPSRFVPARPRASFKNTGEGRPERGPLDGNDIYDNGPINGNTDAWDINFGFIVSDSFNFAYDGTTITGMTFAMWLFPGDTLTSVELSITSGENGGTSYFDQTVSFTQGTCTGNAYGFDICSETASFNGPTMNNGTYWVNLQNASVPSGNPVYWDENSGPSSASENSVGSIPSESFTVLGEATTTTTSSTDDYACPPPQTGFHELHDFGKLSQNDVVSGLAISQTGNVYGTLSAAGSHNQGLIYELAQRAGHWFLTSLYSFLGGSSGTSPRGVIVGPDGVLFGAAEGGIQNCGRDGTSYCGLIYAARPPANACPNALCSWEVTTIYQFTGPSDAAGGTVSTFDSAGNLYGYGANAVFELSPSQGGWTERILYRFTGGSDGNDPNSLLVGHDGNLYGTTLLGGDNNCGYGGPCGVVFQLVPSGNGWAENVLYAFTGATDGAWPGGLVQDGSGNLYGFSLCSSVYNYWDCGRFYYEEYGIIFKLTPSAGGWGFAVIYFALNDCGTAKTTFHALTMDAAGNLFAAEGGVDEGVGEIFNCGRILDLTTGTFPVSGAADIFYNLASDANGNLYGTTHTCGFGTLSRTDGMIWEYSP